MSSKNKFKDIDLYLFNKCNLLDAKQPDPEYLAALYTVKAVLLKQVSQKPITKSIITNIFEEEYKKFFPNTIIKTRQYWDGIKLGRRFIIKLYWLITKYNVLQPIQTYTYILDGSEITGEYALIQKKSETEEPLVLMLHSNRPITYDYPNILNCIKWLDAKGNYLSVGIYNFAMFRSGDWKEKNLDYPLIFNWIRGILLQMKTENKAPNSGSHCSMCLSHNCLKGYV